MSKKTIAWNRLDNAAKIFPSNTGKRDTKVFRFSCELYEEIEPDILQQALDITIESFPFFKSVMKKGLFWYYFEDSRLKPVVTQEHRPVCSPLYDPNNRTLLFEVTYFHKRINFDVFHALTDGTGAMQFLKMMVSQYLRLRYPNMDLPSLECDASTEQKSEDSFQKYYQPQKEKGEKRRKRVTAYQLKGSRLPENRLKVIEGRISVKPVLEEAHRYNTTLTVFIAAILMQAIHKQMPPRDSKKPVVLAVPVNLRNYFDSETARNFFGVINVSYHFGERSGAFEDVLSEVNRCFKEGLTKENLSSIISGYTKIEKNAAVRIVPLPLKNFVLKQAGRMNLEESTMTISNIGRTGIPEKLRDYIKMFGVICSTERMQVCLCSCGDLLTIGFTSSFESTEVQKNFFRSFTAMGIPVEVTSNDCEEDRGRIAKVDPFRPQKSDFSATPEELAQREKRQAKIAGKEQKKAKKAANRADKQDKKDKKKAAKEQKKQQKKATR